MIYFSFIGTHDQIINKKENEYGAALTIFNGFATEIKRVFLFIGNNSRPDIDPSAIVNHKGIAKDIEAFISIRHPNIDVNQIELEIDNPIDYNIIYGSMYDKTREIMTEYNILNEKKIINITSGTPTMATCWILLQKSGLIPNAILIQSFEKRFQRQRKAPFQIVDLEIDKFPEIKEPSAVKRELTKVKVMLDEVGEERDKLELDIKMKQIVGNSASTRDLKKRIMEVASLDNSHVLILGDVGTGKQLVAESIHRFSNRRGKIFRDYNIGGKSTNLIESELFGHEKGAFTGATNKRHGLFLSSDGGTVFLDEIGDTKEQIQIRLLKVMQNGKITPVGVDLEKTVNVRIVAATNKDIASLAEKKEFRYDFLSRFGALIEIDPLSKRPDDIPTLVDHFVELHKLRVVFSPACLDAFCKEDWSIGNVRELEETIKLSDTVYDGVPLERSDIPDIPAKLLLRKKKDLEALPDLPLPDDTTIDEVLLSIRDHYYDKALNRNNNNAEKAAKNDLRMKPHTLRKHLRERKEL